MTIKPDTVSIGPGKNEAVAYPLQNVDIVSPPGRHGH